MATLSPEEKYQQAVDLVDAQITYEEWVTRMHAAGLHDISGALAQLRRRGDVKFSVENRNGETYHTVRPASTDYQPRNWEG